MRPSASGRRLAATAWWTAAATILYTYVGFPLALVLRRALVRRPVRARDHRPVVSIIVAAYNEAAVIAAKLDNVLAVDYDPARLEVIVASDGSDDGTDDIVATYADRGVRLLTLRRTGKAGALNAAMARAAGDIVVFSDADSMFDTDAVRNLVRPFADPAVGAVAGDHRYVRGRDASGLARAEQLYWSFDRWLKRLQSEAGSVTSASGQIYAVRRELLGAVPRGVTDDFYLSTGAVAAGRRLVFAPDAVARSQVASSASQEWRRKVRVITRGLTGVALRRDLLDPRVHGFYAVQLLSHKVLRRVVVVPLLALAAATPVLWRAGPLQRAVAVVQAVVYGAGALGVAAGDPPSALRLPAYFCMVNAACLRALVNVLAGARVNHWEPARDPSRR